MVVVVACLLVTVVEVRDAILTNVLISSVDVLSVLIRLGVSLNSSGGSSFPILVEGYSPRGGRKEVG